MGVDQTAENIPPATALSSRLARAPLLSWDLLRFLPLALSVVWTLKRHTDVREVLSRLTPGAPPGVRTSSSMRLRTVRALRWIFLLFPLGPAQGSCLPRSLAVYSALRRQGWPVRFASGVRRGPSGLEGHAWVEDEDGTILPEESPAQPEQRYEASFRYPAAV